MSEPSPAEQVRLPVGWGRLLFAQTFPDSESLARAMLEEQEGQRDIAIYVQDPHLVVAEAPQDLFLDPSLTYRLDLETYEEASAYLEGWTIERPRCREDWDAINGIYLSHQMVPVDTERVWAERDSGVFFYLVARPSAGGPVMGVVLGIDHVRAFRDPANGCSLWALAVHKQADDPGLGEALSRAVIDRFRARGRRQLDLSVLHDNEPALQLYRRLGFQKVEVFVLKNRNPINERLFVGEPPDSGFNPYAEIILNEALRRGIRVSEADPERGLFTLSLGGRSVACWESLTELTSAIAAHRCADKSLTRQIWAEAGLRVPEQLVYESPEQAESFLAEHGEIVVKPAVGEQGLGVAVGLRDAGETHEAIAQARALSAEVLLESCHPGQDLRVIVIQQEVVAASVRRPAAIQGDGRKTARQLIQRLSRRRSRMTGGESSIPLDAETERCLTAAGYTLDAVLPADAVVEVRRAANVHTGGTIQDVTDQLHPALVEAALRAAEALAIPVTGLDFLVPDPGSADYVLIEANERPGLANHEPQPTAQKFMDFLFPSSIPHADWHGSR
jgi:GNAT-family acetyltransferase (TIGR03103 family)